MRDICNATKCGVIMDDMMNVDSSFIVAEGWGIPAPTPIRVSSRLISVHMGWRRTVDGGENPGG